MSYMDEETYMKHLMSQRPEVIIQCLEHRINLGSRIRCKNNYEFEVIKSNIKERFIESFIEQCTKYGYINFLNSNEWRYYIKKFTIQKKLNDIEKDFK